MRQYLPLLSAYWRLGDASIWFWNPILALLLVVPFHVSTRLY
jgi:hypothetical protein